jgi:hypothetical protein
MDEREVAGRGDLLFVRGEADLRQLGARPI